MRSGCFLQILTLLFSFAIKAQNPGEWTYVGPKENQEQVKGFIKALWVDENDLNFVLAGGGSAGLFKSENAMSEKPQWKNITDSYGGINFGVSDIVVIPNTGRKSIYISTAHQSGLPIGYGNGILKSIDGGATWLHVGPAPQDENLLALDGLVANTENYNEMIAYSSNEVFITRDAWHTYSTVNFPIDKQDKNVSFSDADFAPFEPGKFYICTRTNDHYDAKLFLCENYGEKITEISPKDIKAGRIEVTTVFRENFKSKFYVALGTQDMFIKFFDGKSFSKNLNSTPVNHTFATPYWNLELCVNQQDTNVMYLSLTETSRSVDGGKTFQKLNFYNAHNTHADVRAMLLAKSTKGGMNDALFLGNDGGVSFIQKYAPADWKNLNGAGLDANQFWGISVAQSDTLFVAGGTQDNGGFLITDKYNINTMNNCGDGYLALAIDKHSAIVECNVPSMFYHNIETNQHIYLPIADSRCEGRRPLLLRDSFIYAGYHDLWRISKASLKKGKINFTKITSIPLEERGASIYRNNGIKCMDIGPLNTAVICYGGPNWMEENKAKVYFCRDFKNNNNEWVDITPLLVHGQFEVCRWTEINAIEMDLYNPFRFYIVSRDEFNQTNCKLFSVQYKPDSNKCVLQNFTYDLPKLGMNKIKTDRFSGVTYLACDNGVYYSDLRDENIIWTKLNGNNKLPNVMVLDVDINYVANTLFAGTYGRGVWQTRPVNSLKTNRYISKTSTENNAIKVDGQLTIGKKKTYTINSKLIITKGSRIELKAKSLLVIRDKNLIKDENNKHIDINSYLLKSKSARVLIGE